MSDRLTELLASVDVPPEPAIAARLLAEVGWDKRLIGYRVAQMAGNTVQPLYSLEEVLRFLHGAPAAELLSVGGKPTLGYIEPSILARWVGDVLNDTCLAAALTTVAETTPVYADTVEPMRALIRRRLDAAREALAVPR